MHQQTDESYNESEKLKINPQENQQNYIIKGLENKIIVVESTNQLLKFILKMLGITLIIILILGVIAVTNREMDDDGYLFNIQINKQGSEQQTQNNNIDSDDEIRQLKNDINQLNHQDVQNLAAGIIKNNQPAKETQYNILLKKFIKHNLHNHLLRKHAKPNDTFQFTGLTFHQMAKAAIYRTLVDNSSNTKLIKQQYEYYDTKYQISKYDSEIPFCVAVTTYNTAKGDIYKRNLISILQQNYTNYHVVVYDDASTDKTAEKIKTFLQNHPLKNKVSLIINTINKSSLQNLIDAAKNHCKPNQIFFRVDGDDQLIGMQVLKLFNALYQQSQLWNIYTTSITSKFTVGYSRPYHNNVIKKNNFRKAPFSFFHQTSFYTQLILKIKDEDLRDDRGQYFRASSDNVILTPVYQMCHYNLKYVPQITYYYNRETNISENSRKSDVQRKVGTAIYHRKKYEPLKSLFTSQK